MTKCVSSAVLLICFVLACVTRLATAQTTVLIDEKIVTTLECGSGLVVSQTCVELEVRYQYRCTIPPGFDLCPADPDFYEVRAFATVTGTTNLPLQGTAQMRTSWKCVAPPELDPPPPPFRISERGCYEADGSRRSGDKHVSCGWPGLGGAQGCAVSLIAPLGNAQGAGDPIQYACVGSGFDRFCGPVWEVTSVVSAAALVSGVNVTRTDYVRVIDGKIVIGELDQ